MAFSNLRQKIVFLVHAVSLYLRTLFSVMSTYIFRLQGDECKEKEVVAPDENDGSEEVRGLNDVVVEEEKPEVFLKFKFPSYEEFSRIEKETVDAFNSRVVPDVSTGKYDFTSGKSFITDFIDELETFPVKEIKIDSSEAETGSPHDKGKQILEKNDECVNECELISEKNSVVTDFGSESTSFEHMNCSVNSYFDGFLSDGDFGDGNEKMESETDSELSGFEDNHDSSDEENDKMEEHNLQNRDSGFLQQKDCNEDLDNVKDDEFVTEDDKGDANKLESLWEHQELIEQLKMELKKVRATGLPTILEESESPKISDDLKPWKIDEFQREDCIGELHKFYKSYRERMRKFDIMNYQKMYAMGFLQLKDPLQSMSKQKHSPPTLKSLVSENLWIFRHKIHVTDPMKKFIEELQGELESVYVGQMCLSWEFLHWQYKKVWDIWDSDTRGTRRYNEVAGEFQQFQVLMQRFIEDEPFQGPRVQNYVKRRCAVRNLLQVPVIREDNMKDKRKARKRDADEYVITTDMLVEIVEESIRIFWQFVRADKGCTIGSVNGHKKLPELPSSDDLELLMELKKVLLKKERKIKDVLRSENCIMRKFRRCREDDDSDQVLYFFSQVDIKLVSRVLNMSKVTRDQLIWCRNKLNRISFVNRKICVEPAFLLFPC